VLHSDNRNRLYNLLRGFVRRGDATVLLVSSLNDFITPPSAWERISTDDERVFLSVLCEHISEIIHPNVIEFPVHVACGRVRVFMVLL